MEHLTSQTISILIWSQVMCVQCAAAFVLTLENFVRRAEVSLDQVNQQVVSE